MKHQPKHTLTLQEESVHINAFGRRLADVLLVVARNLILQDDRVERPALVGSGHFLCDKKKPKKNRHLVKMNAHNRVGFLFRCCCLRRLGLFVRTCRMAVRKPCGLKKPVIQNTLGRSVRNHVRNWVLRSSSSVYQKPSVVDSHEICLVFKCTVLIQKKKLFN